MIRGSKSANPFPGLRAFQQDEDYLFFGREEQTIELVRRLGSHRFLAVVGTSGSGKSSLVRCGLLSELHGGRMLQAGAAWEVAVTHPGGNPLALLTDALLEAGLYDASVEDARENLLATLSRSHRGLVEAVRQSGIGRETNFLLVVDQFEEIFRFREAGQTQQEAAAEFVSLLLESIEQTEVPIYVVLTMRSDFIGECSQFEGLSEMVNSGEFLIPRLTREQYKRVIEGPIRVAGGRIAPRLLQRLLNDLGQQADQLPCLQHALMRTWDVWATAGDTEALDLDDYRRVGGMAEALSIHADEVYASLGGEREREWCRGLFEALTVKESENRGIRRPQRLSNLCEIIDVTPAQLIPIIDAFRRPGVTFLMPSAEVDLTESTIIDISHESLMRVWTRLRHWVEEEAQAAGIYLRLAESATLHAQGKAGLYRDPELGIALGWLNRARHPNRAWAERYRRGFPEAMAFLAASQEAGEAEEREKELARQREVAQAQALAEAERLRADEQRQGARRLRKLLAAAA
ncbi:MAG: ATP-binding protein, partial [Verrucomicrobiales bacterium]